MQSMHRFQQNLSGAVAGTAPNHILRLSRWKKPTRNTHLTRRTTYTESSYTLPHLTGDFFIFLQTEINKISMIY